MCKFTNANVKKSKNTKIAENHTRENQNPNSVKIKSQFTKMLALKDGGENGGL